MKFRSPGHHRSVEGFKRHWLGLDAAMGCDDELLGAAGPLGQPFELGDRRIGNRFAVHPMEGWDSMPDGLPSERTLRRWHNFGRSGAKLIWGGEAFAVQEDGRDNPCQLYHNQACDVEGGLLALRQSVVRGHREQGFTVDDMYVGLQLTHSGRYSRPSADGGRNSSSLSWSAT